MLKTSLQIVSLLCLAAFVSSTKRSFLSGTAQRNPKSTVDPENCFFDGQRTCFSCKNAALCVDTTNGMTAYDEPCYSAGEVCNIAQGATEAACTPTPAVDEPGIECFCNPSLTQPRTENDVYTLHAYLFCDNDFTYYRTCYNDYLYNSNLGDCAPIAPTCQYIGIFPFPDDCDFYYTCLQVGQPGTVEMCSVGEFFDPNVGHCDANPDTTTPCTDDSDNPITGTVASPIYCSYFYVCDNGTNISIEGCNVGEIFSQDDNQCMPDDGSCISTGYCF